MTARDREIHKLFADVMNLGNGVVHDDLSAADMPGWNSSRHVELVLAMESRFGVRFSAPEVVGLETLGDIKRAVGAKLDARRDQ